MRRIFYPRGHLISRITHSWATRPTEIIEQDPQFDTITNPFSLLLVHPVPCNNRYPAKGSQKRLTPEPLFAYASCVLCNKSSSSVIDVTSRELHDTLQRGPFVSFRSIVWRLDDPFMQIVRHIMTSRYNPIFLFAFSDIVRLLSLCVSGSSKTVIYL